MLDRLIGSRKHCQRSKVKEWKGLSRKLHMKQFSLPDKQAVENTKPYTLPSDPFTRQLETREERSCWQLRLHTTKQHTCLSKGWLRVGMGVGGVGTSLPVLQEPHFNM